MDDYNRQQFPSSSSELLLICIPINLIGVLYVIFVLKEVKHEQKDDRSRRTSGVSNPGFDDMPADRRPSMRRSLSISEEPKFNSNKPCLVDFFNPIVAVNCLRVIVRKRPNNARRVVILLLVLYFVAIGPAFGEEPNEYNFTRIKLNWDGLAYSPFATYGNAISLVGTMIMVGGLSKLYHLSDPLVGFLGTCFSSVSRIVYVSDSFRFVLLSWLHIMLIARTFHFRRLRKRERTCTWLDRWTCSSAYVR